MKKLSTIFTILAIVSVLGLLALNKGEGLSPVASPTPSPEVTIENTTPSPEVTYSFRAEVSGQTAYELLKNKAEVEFSETTQGATVFSVYGMKNTDNRRWTFLINGQPATQAAEKTTLRSGDELTLTYSGE